MRILFIFIILLLTAERSSAQFWFGPKVGIHRTGFLYQDDKHKFLPDGTSELTQDNLYNKVKANYNWHAGGMMTYTASLKYAVHGELFYERVVKRVTSNSFDLDNKFSYSFISVPLLLRVTFGREPIYYYVNGGPKLSYWISGKANIFAGVQGQGDTGFLKYKIRYSADKTNGENEIAVDNPNRLQYALNFGGGALLDLKTGGRLQLDFRYSWGHSNMGFNRGSQLEEFLENVEVRNQIISCSVGYLFPFNPIDARKGSSTNKLINTKKNKKSKKKGNG